jgi:2-polyprenyl-6-methoxyphenol hydroxylase-like FAD-dependent oxidoreductase
VEPPSFNPQLRDYDVAIVGAGPVGLAIAIELSQLGLAVVVLDRRPPLTQDTKARPQLLADR